MPKTGNQLSSITTPCETARDSATLAQPIKWRGAQQQNSLADSGNLPTGCHTLVLLTVDVSLLPVPRAVILPTMQDAAA